MSNSSGHTPVLVEEVLAHFQPKKGDKLLDATIGHGGHARAFLEKAGAESTVVGVDTDPDALAVARAHLQEYGDRVTYVRRNFVQLTEAVQDVGVDVFTHVLFDLGVGSHQLADSERGFSFESEGSLVMRYGDVSYLPPARVGAVNVLEKKLGGYPDVQNLIEGLTVKELARVLREYGEERYAKRIANAIKSSHSMPKTARALAAIVTQAVPPSYERGRIHPATRTFQGLRLAVNRELESLEVALPQAVELLGKGGKLAVISFHSLEDRIVKQFFRRESRDCICPPQQIPCVCEHQGTLKILTRKPVTASEEEKAKNPRSRSAKLRVSEKLRN